LRRVDERRQLLDGGQAPPEPSADDLLVAATDGADPVRGVERQDLLPHETRLVVEHGLALESRQDLEELRGV